MRMTGEYMLKKEDHSVTFHTEKKQYKELKKKLQKAGPNGKRVMMRTFFEKCAKAYLDGKICL